MDSFFVFKTVNKFQAEELFNPAQGIHESLQGIFKTRDTMQIEFHFNNFEFCRSHNFSLEKTSAFLGILDWLLTNTNRSKSLSQQAFDQILKKHSVQRTPYSILVFTTKEIQKIKEFVDNSFFRHYDLYKYAYIEQKDIFLSTASKFTSPMPHNLPLSLEDAVNPEDFPVLSSYFQKQEEEEAPPSERERDSAIEEESIDDDPVAVAIRDQIKNLRNKMNETMQEMDKGIYAQIDTLKNK